MKRPLLAIIAVLAFFTSYGQPESVKKLDINLENYTYPYPVKFLKLNVQQQEIQMAYMDINPANYNGKNVLLLHGKNFNGAYWGTTIAALAKEGFRVIVPDQVGFGKSTKPKCFQYTFQQLALNTKTLLDSLGIKKTTVLGHSMGGMIAVRFALMYPQTSEKVVLEDPLGLEDWKLKVPYTSVNEAYKNELKSNYAGIKKYQVENYYHGEWKAAYEPWAALLAGWTLSEDYPLIAWNAALTFDMIFTQPVCYEFQNIKSPTLLIVGKLDKTAIGKQLVPEAVRKTMGDYATLGKTTRDKIPNCTLVELENVGHLPHIEAFDRFIKPLLAFLKK
ncbi:MAG TPA: alpha/beta hydrolase [Hanamia sp.]|nr:alpha/beta hydrolase [Hanamia sp.]